MNKTKKLIAAALSCVALNASANHCEELKINLINETSSECRLLKIKISHGNYMPAQKPPVYLKPFSESNAFSIKQDISGISQTLSYSCGEKVISFKSEQSVCFGLAGVTSASIVDARGMGAQPVVQQGSSLWSKHGDIRWHLN